jgi:mRNA interferase RelE/StbE
MWAVAYSADALKTLTHMDGARMDGTVAKRLRAKILDLARDPLAPRNNAKRMKGADAYRYRMGDWRVIYTLDRKAKVLTVIAAGPRGSVYE